MINVQRHQWISKHGAPAGIGLIALAVLAMTTVAPPVILGSLTDRTVVDIGIEHSEPLSIGMEVGVRSGSAVVEFFSESPETILISVPSTWVRREVRNASISDVTAEPPSLGYTRWTLPPRAGISFRAPEAPDTVVLHNPTEVQMKLSLVRVDLETEEVERDVLLIQEDTMTLW